MRIGIGYDIHRLVEGRALVLGGVQIDFPKGLEGHSDADVLLHAICDAILGALGKGDIGERFPDTDMRYKGIASSKLLKDVMGLVKTQNFMVQNVDCTVIAENPKIAPYRDKIKGAISEIMELPAELISIKAKTAETLGAVGKGEAIAAYAAVLLEKKEG